MNAPRGAVDERIARLARMLFEEQIPYNALLGVEVDFLDRERASLRFRLRDELLGNYVRRMLHGGVIASVLDAAAGLVAFMGVVDQADEQAGDDERIARFSRIGTIDMRVDFLRPAMGSEFIASAHPLRTGSRVAVIRTELHNEDGELVASGTCTYMVG